MASEDKFVSVGLDVHERRKPPIKTHGSIRHGCDVDSATVRRPVASVTACPERGLRPGVVSGN